MKEIKKDFLFGDCLEKMSLIPDKSVDLVFTSPPYADKRKNVYDTVSEEKYVEWFLPRAKQIKRILNPRGSFFLNIKPGSNNGERSLYVFDLVLALKRELDFKFIDEFSWVKMPYMGSYPNKLKNSFEPIYHFSVDNPNDIIFNPLACGTPLKDSSLKRAFRKE
jgi:DNA modification methylase